MNRLMTAALALGLVVIGPAQGQAKREPDLLTPSTSQETIAEWGREAPKPLWRIPLGTTFVDALDPLDGDQLLLGLKGVGKNVPNRECLLVDLQRGVAIWRQARKPRGDYTLLYADSDLLVFQIDGQDERSLQVLDRASGKESWQLKSHDKADSFTLSGQSGVILVESRMRDAQQVSVLELTDGSVRWQLALPLPAEGAARLPALPAGAGFLLRSGGLRYVDATNGRVRWAREDLTLTETDPEPVFGGPGLLLAVNGGVQALDLDTGVSAWSSAMPGVVTSLFLLEDALYLRSVLPYSDPRGRFRVQVPTGWSPARESPDGVRTSFQIPEIGGLLTVYCFAGIADASRVHDGLKRALEGLALAGVHRLDEGAGERDGKRLQWGHYELKAGQEGTDETSELIYGIGAIEDTARNVTLALMASGPALVMERVHSDFERVFSTLVFGAGETGDDNELLARWQQRSQSAAASRYRISKLDPANGHRYWETATEEATLSNFVAVDDKILVASTTDLLAFDPSTGRALFGAKVAEGGRPYPVELVPYADRVVFIGELQVAAFSLQDGKPLYAHGLTPISQQATLTGLDTGIPRYQQLIASLEGLSLTDGTAGLLAAQADADATKFQQLSRHYRKQARGEITAGAGMPQESNRELAALKSGFAARAEADARLASLVYSLTEVGTIIWNGLIIRGWVHRYEDLLARQRLFRRSVLGAYPLGRVGDYVFRPSLRITGDGSGSFVTVTIIHLPTGQRRSTVLSPEYMDYGLWNWVDLGRGVVYHHGVGMDPAAYIYGPPEEVGLQGSVRLLEAQLIASPLAIP